VRSHFLLASFFAASGVLVSAGAGCVGKTVDVGVGDEPDSGGSGPSGESSSGAGMSDGSSSGSSSDARPTDASPAFDAPRAPAGLAGFAFVVNGVVQTPLTCPAEGWEYPPPVGPTGQPIIEVPSEAGLPLGTDTICNGAIPPCAGLTVLLVNTGQFPVAYTAQTTWSGWEPPGVPFGNTSELSGVMDPGASVDITSVYVGGIVAVLGSSHPFVDPNAGKYVADGTTVSWPAGVAGSGGATQMYVAEIEIEDACRNPATYWP
jgi:hypothetical protein